MKGKKTNVIVSTDELNALKKLEAKLTAANGLVTRARIIIMAATGMKHKAIAAQLQVHANHITKWVKRWIATADQGLSVEERLADLPRSGAPDTFSPEQICRLIALACEDPALYDRPITDWAGRELADEAIKQGIVSSISPRHVNRLLDQFDLHPHKSQYWLNGQPDLHKKEKIADINRLYEQAAATPTDSDTLYISVDEKPGIQALEREAPTKLAKPGYSKKIEFNYERHGTLEAVLKLF